MCKYYLEGLKNADDRIYNIAGRCWTSIDASRSEFYKATVRMVRFKSRKAIDVWHAFRLEVVIDRFKKGNTRYIFHSIRLPYLRLEKFNHFAIIPNAMVGSDANLRQKDLLTDALETYLRPRLLEQYVLTYGEA